MESSINYFKENILPIIKDHYLIDFSTFTEREIIGFGDLERIEIEGNILLGGVEFWSKGWLGIHCVNIENDEELLNVLIPPDEDSRKVEELDRFEKILAKFSQ